MEKRASNTFVGGVVTDRHPLTAQNTELIDARNIDLIQVGEGYQLILQKRVGNTELLYDDGLGGGAVPAGLASTYVPLAVKEFNNVAYIISVDPTTNPPTGQIGTFPSPNYADFAYVEGSPIATVTVIDSQIWDPIADSADYAFTLTPAGPVADQEVAGNGGLDLLLTATFQLNNTGALSDTFYITLASGTGLNIYADGVLYVPASGVTVGPGAHKHITFRIADSMAQTPITPYVVIATITPENGSVASIKTFQFTYHTTVALQVMRDDSLSNWWGGTVPDPWANDINETFTIAGIAAARYIWRCNDGAATTTLSIPSPSAGMSWSDLPLLHVVTISVDPNGGAPRQGVFRLTGSAGDTLDFVINQEGV